MEIQQLKQIYIESKTDLSFADFCKYYMMDYNSKIKGTFRIYETNDYKLVDKNYDDVKRDLEPKQVAEFNNQILQDGLLIYLNRMHDSVLGIQCGTGGTIASTFATQQAHQAPLANLVFRREGIYQKSSLLSGGNIVGWRYTYPFVRPATSYGGTTINEIGILVSDLTSSSLLCRLIAGSGAGATNALPHTFNSSLDTLCFYDIEFYAGS